MSGAIRSTRSPGRNTASTAGSATRTVTPTSPAGTVGVPRTVGVPGAEPADADSSGESDGRDVGDGRDVADERDVGDGGTAQAPGSGLPPLDPAGALTSTPAARARSAAT